ncbi:hypothetical protein [Nocardia sp. NPDC057227]|uniref:hypothetical protein n=1 Tax=Nocardia sp. NPDC057227 TaxID=3346056 RepID=UPI00363EE836
MKNRDWRNQAEYVYSESRFLIGEADDGRLYARQLRRPVYRRFDRRNPLHWLAWLGTRLRLQVVWLELEPAGTE